MIQMDHKGNTGVGAEPTGSSQLGDWGKLLNLSFLLCKMGIIRVAVPQGCSRDEKR